MATHVEIRCPVCRDKWDAIIPDGSDPDCIGEAMLPWLEKHESCMTCRECGHMQDKHGALDPACGHKWCGCPGFVSRGLRTEQT